MKAKIKTTGEVVEVTPKGVEDVPTRVFGLEGDASNPELRIPDYALEFEKEIDWEARQWQAALELIVVLHGTPEECARYAVERAKALVAEYRKGE